MSTHRSISGMSIFKTRQSSPTKDSKDNGEREHLFVALTLDRPQISRVSDGVKVDGVLEAGRALLRLEMVKDIDCSAMYSCEVRTSDSQGSELVQINRLHQKPEQSVGPADVELMPSRELFQQLALLQEQVTSLGASLDGKLGDPDTHLDDKLGSLEMRIDRKFEALGGELKDLHIRLDSIENLANSRVLGAQNQIEDVIETRVMKKLHLVETKLSAIDDKEHVIPQTLEGLEKSLRTLTKQLDDENEDFLRLYALVVSNSTDEKVDAMQGHNSEILTCKTQRDQRFNDFKVTKEEIVNSSQQVIHHLESGLSELQWTLRTEFKQVKLDMHTSFGKMLSNVDDLIAHANTTAWNNLGPAIMDILTPKSCRRGCFPLPHDLAFPYHVIQPNAESELGVPYLCDSVSDGGGWIVIQRRSMGAVDFFRNWQDYKEGFGSLAGDFWLGNRYIHSLTNSGKYELRVDVTCKGKSGYAHYNSFSLGGENDNFSLRVAGYDGTAGDSLAYHNGKPFSTHDRDHDGWADNRAEVYSGAWWYDGGYHSNLNARWNTSGNKAARWDTWCVRDSVSFSEMKIRKT